MKPFPAKRILCALFMAVFPALRGNSAGFEAPGPGTSITVRVEIILAQKKNSGVDPRLKEMEKKLEPYLNFRSYRLVSGETKTLSPGQAFHLSLPAQGKFDLKWEAQDEAGRITLRVESIGRRPFKTRIRLKPGSAMIFHGPGTREGEILIHVRLMPPADGEGETETLSSAQPSAKEASGTKDPAG